MNSPAFLDTVGLLALWDIRDSWHEPASSAFDAIARSGRDMVTTTFILLECGNAAARRPYRLAVDRLWSRLEAAGLLVVPTESDVAEALAGYRAGSAAAAGLVDQVSFAVMRRLGLTEVFTNDRHFKAAGFITLF